MLDPLYTADEMRAAEAGHDVGELMERAGRAVADAILERYPDARKVAAVCGKGANGGDGRIAARILEEAGREIVDETELGLADLVVDALFGTGFHGKPRSEAEQLIRDIDATPAPVVSVDIPSGVDASTGEVPSVAVHAEVTVTFHGRKVGHVVAPGRFHCGELLVADIGLEPQETEHRLVGDEVLEHVPRRRDGDNKYSAGAVLVVGGASGLTGAACLAAEAAFRADAGYVAVAVPERSLPIVEQRLLEAVKRTIDEVDELLPRMSALALGPGLGRGEAEQSLVRRLLEESSLPAVVDADGLHELEPFERDAPTVLTPHEGELGRLLGRESKWVAENRLEALRQGVERFGCVVLLKGADTLVGAPGGGVLVRSSNAPGLATAGTGDVLTGILAAFLAKGMDAKLAAAAAAVAQARAALLAPQQVGLVASDVIAHLPRALA
jgi:ADP-dependent NAD(P)H-hydrate dehydratase / NAD(P)H-hydrate epimerase